MTNSGMDNNSLINTTTSDIKSWMVEVQDKLKSDKTFTFGLQTSVDTQSKIEELWLADLNSVVNYVCPLYHGALVPKSSQTESDTIAKAHGIIGVGSSVSLEAHVKFSNFIHRLLNGERPNTLSLQRVTDVANRNHEAVVGFFGTNLIRSRVPNFPFVYALVKDSESSSFIATEKITPNISMATFLESASPSDFLAILMQVLYALKTARDAIGFTHYNMTIENVLLRETTCQHPFYIPYEDGAVMIKSKYIVTFVNFSKSHIFSTNSDKRRVSFGCKDQNQVPYGVFRDRVFPIADAYKFIVTSLVALQSSSNKSTFETVSSIMKYFNQTETVNEIIDNQREIGYSLTPTTKSRAYSLEDLIDFSRTVAKKWPGAQNIVVSNSALPKNARIYGFMRGAWDCVEKYKINEIISETSPGILLHHVTSMPNSLFGFFDIHAHLVKLRESGNQNARATLRTFTGEYIKGFTKGESCFHKAMNLAVLTCREYYEISIRPQFEPDSNGKAVFRYYALPTEVDLLYENPKIVKQCCETIQTCLNVFHALNLIIENLRVFKYAINIYWADGSGEHPTGEITSAYESIVDLIAKSIVPFKEIELLLREDARVVSREKFNDKPTPDLLKARLKMAESQNVAFIINSFYPTWKFASETLGKIN